MAKPTETRQAYEKKVRAQFDKLNAQIAEIKAKGDQAKADASVAFNSRLEELYAKRDAAQLKLEELHRASEDAWQEVQQGLDTAWSELQSAFDAAVKRLQTGL